MKSDGDCPDNFPPVRPARRIVTIGNWIADRAESETKVRASVAGPPHRLGRWYRCVAVIIFGAIVGWLILGSTTNVVHSSIGLATKVSISNTADKFKDEGMSNPMIDSNNPTMLSLMNLAPATDAPQPASA